MSEQPIRVWYCGRCRHALRVEPATAFKASCRCEVPVVPVGGPTLVWDLQRASHDEAPPS